MPPINEQDIIELENYLECTFPDDYKSFLLKYNGGEPDKTLIYFGNEGGIIDVFLGINKEYCYSIKRKNNMFIGRVPSNTIAIASDPGGNLFLISIRGDDYGQIYFWDHEFEVDWNSGQEADYSNLTFVAKSFTDLINNLRDISELDSK